MNLRLLQIADSGLPISGYTHSWGLEAAIARGLVHDPATLECWTLQWLKGSLGPLEGVLVASSHRAARDGRTDDLQVMNQMLEVSIVPPTIRAASREMGDQLLTLGSTWEWSVGGLSRIPRGSDEHFHGWHHAIAFGLMGALAGGDPAETLTVYLHQAALGMILAGVRSVPVGHTHGQQILAYLHEEIRALTDELVNRAMETAGAGAPFYEILCDEQTRLYARVFRS